MEQIETINTEIYTEDIENNVSKITPTIIDNSTKTPKNLEDSINTFLSYITDKINKKGTINYESIKNWRKNHQIDSVTQIETLCNTRICFDSIATIHFSHTQFFPISQNNHKNPLSSLTIKGDNLNA